MEFVKDKNLNRRQLTQSQKAMVAARMMPLYAEEAKRRKMMNSPFIKEHSKDPIESFEQMGKTATIVSEMVGASRGTTNRAAKILRDGSDELIASVDNNEVSVYGGELIAKLPKEQQVTALADYRKKKENPQPRQQRIDKEEVKRKTAEWMEKNKTEFTEEDKLLDGMVEKIVIATSQSLQEISNFDPTMSSKVNESTILRRAIRATDKYINDLESIEYNNKANEGV